MYRLPTILKCVKRVFYCVQGNSIGKEWIVNEFRVIRRIILLILIIILFQ